MGIHKRPAKSVSVPFVQRRAIEVKLQLRLEGSNGAGVEQ
jgi:hypothetical protein